MRTTDSTARSTGRCLTSERHNSQAWWFLGDLAVLRNPEGAPRVPAVIELTIPPGGSPPLHVHDTLDDSFLVLDGEVVVRCGDETLTGRPGSYVSIPKGVPHTFRVTSAGPAHLLSVHADDSFLGFIEELGTPTDEHDLPPSDELDHDLETLVAAAERHDLHIIGPSLGDDEARSFLDDIDPMPPLGAINHVALTVTDLRRSEPWYATTLGLTRISGDVADDGTGHIALLHPPTGWVIALASGPLPGLDHLAFSCADRDELLSWHKTLADRGRTPGSITDAPYGSGFVLTDPDNIQLELFAPLVGITEDSPDSITEIPHP